MLHSLYMYICACILSERPTCYMTWGLSIYDIEYEESHGNARRISTTVEFFTDKEKGMFFKLVCMISMLLYTFRNNI